MHIEPGVVDGAKIVLSYATAAAAFGLTAWMARQDARAEAQRGGWPALLARSLLTTLAVFCFFEVFPHAPVGVSEVHLILGSTLLLLFGAGATAIGLAAGLLAQGLLFAPADLPQYGMNVTTLLVPLYAIHQLAQRIIPARTAYVDIQYRQALMLSLAYQGGIVLWVAFWALYGHGVGTNTLAEVGSFGLAYMGVVLLEPLIDLAVLWGAKTLAGLTRGRLFAARLHAAGTPV
jgi:ABC-type Co2+ transport system permease subunit